MVLGYKIIMTPKELPFLFTTIKDKIFDHLSKHPEIKDGVVLWEDFPNEAKSTIYAYLQEWKIKQKQDAKITEYIRDIYIMIRVLKFKSYIEKQWSAKEQRSFERIGLLLERYKELWEDLDPSYVKPVVVPKPKVQRKKRTKKKLLRLNFNGD